MFYFMKISSLKLTASEKSWHMSYMMHVLNSPNTGCLGEYLDLRGMKRQDVGENCIMGSCIFCTVFPVLLE
jgi:hypothetical protein